MNRKIIIENRLGEKYQVKGLIKKTGEYETYLCVGAQSDNKGKKWIVHKIREAGAPQIYDVPKVDEKESLKDVPAGNLSTGTSKHIAGCNKQKEENIDTRIKAGIKETGRVKL